MRVSRLEPSLNQWQRKRESITPPTVKVNDLPLERVYSYKYLGILITSDLSWSAHVATICSKARQQIGLLYRRFYKYSNMDTLKQLYTAFVRPHLEYAVPVWDPHLTKDINALEAVQRFACRVCIKSWDMSYSDMLQTMNIPRLSERRRLLKMCNLMAAFAASMSFTSVFMAPSKLGLELSTKWNKHSASCFISSEGLWRIWKLKQLHNTYSFIQLVQSWITHLLEVKFEILS